MLKTVAMMLSFFMLNFSQAEENKTLMPCYNSGPGTVGGGFVLCINSNYSSIANKLNVKNISVFMRYCSNWNNDKLDQSFIYCVNDNFNEIERAVSGMPFLRFCDNFGDGVSFSFESCINANFGIIERHFQFDQKGGIWPGVAGL